MHNAPNTISGQIYEWMELRKKADADRAKNGEYAAARAQTFAQEAKRLSVSIRSQLEKLGVKDAADLARYMTECVHPMEHQSKINPGYVYAMITQVTDALTEWAWEEEIPALSAA